MDSPNSQSIWAEIAAGLGSARPKQLTLYRTTIPMLRFEHAAARRNVAEAVVSHLEFEDGRSGWGESLPRPYVTGETIESVIADTEAIVWPAFTQACAAGGQMDLDAALPCRTDDGRCLNAAACCLELAVVSALISLPDIVLRRPIAVRATGVLGSSNPVKTAWALRAMRLYCLRDIKLKMGLGDAVDTANLRAIQRQIGRGIANRTRTLRVDVNGAWSLATAADRIVEPREFGVCVVEQPATCTAAQLVDLADKCEVPLMADESLLTLADARVLMRQPRRIWWNVRISKNGGFLRALQLAELARENDIHCVIGCMVGESGLLSAAQRRLLQLAPPVKCVEGNHGRWLLADDLTTKSPRFSWGGRLKPLTGQGFGISIDPAKLARYGQVVKTLKA